jgi:hypothetical protein
MDYMVMLGLLAIGLIGWFSYLIISGLRAMLEEDRQVWKETK